MSEEEFKIDELYDPKKENVPYTFAIIKPETCTDIDKIQKIIEKIEKEGFVIKAMLQREPTKQEI